MPNKYSIKDYEARNLFVGMAKGVLEDFNGRFMLVSLIEEYHGIKDELSEEIYDILIKAKTIDLDNDPKEMILSKVKQMYDSLKELDEEF